MSKVSAASPRRNLRRIPGDAAFQREGPHRTANQHQELLELGGVYAQLRAVNYGVEVVDSVPEGRGDP